RDRAICLARSNHPFADWHGGGIEASAVKSARPYGNLAENRARANDRGAARLGSSGGQRYSRTSMEARAVAQAHDGLLADLERVVGALHVHGPAEGIPPLG